MKNILSKKNNKSREKQNCYKANANAHCIVQQVSRPIALAVSGAVVPISDGAQDTADGSILNLLSLLHVYLSLLVCIYILSYNNGNCKLECCTKRIIKKNLPLCNMPKHREVAVVCAGPPIIGEEGAGVGHRHGIHYRMIIIINY